MTTHVFVVTQKANLVAGGRVNGVSGVVVTAADSDQAIAIAAGALSVDASTLWTNATATELDTDTDFTGYTMTLSVQDADLDYVYQATTGLDENFTVNDGDYTVDDGGASYVVGNTVSIAVVDDGDVAATFRVQSVDGGGAITALALIDPGSFASHLDGSYNLAGGAGTGGTIAVTSSATSFLALLAKAARGLRADALAFTASIDVRTPKLVAHAAGKGDHTLFLEVRGVDADGNTAVSTVSGIVGAYTDAGSSGSALSVALTIPAFAPKPLLTFK